MSVLARLFVVLAALGMVAVAAVPADAEVERLDFSGCFSVHQFDVCAEITGVRHQTIAPNGVVVTGFTEFSCFTISSGGAFVSQTCTKEHNMSLSRDGFLTAIHDSGQIAFSDGTRTCQARFLLQIVDGRVLPASTDLTCP